MALPTPQFVINTIKGKKWDVDHTGDYDCVDVAKEADNLYHPGIGWLTTGIHGNGKDIFANANPKYYKKVVNDHNNPNQLPPIGAIICFDATPKAGYTNTYPNPYGHVALVVVATPASVTILMQASGTGKAAWLDIHSWRYRPCQGWLIPFDTAPAPAPAPKPVPSPVPTVPKSQLDAANKTVSDLQAQLASVQKSDAAKLDACNTQIKILTNANQKLTAQLAAQGQDTTQLNSLGTLLVWFIHRLGLK